MTSGLTHRKPRPLGPLSALQAIELLGLHAEHCAANGKWLVGTRMAKSYPYGGNYRLEDAATAYLLDHWKRTGENRMFEVHRILNGEMSK